jgi:hypothetical protein
LVYSGGDWLIVQAAKGQYKVLLNLGGGSGLRAGELFGLHVDEYQPSGISFDIRNIRRVWLRQNPAQCFFAAFFRRSAPCFFIDSDNRFLPAAVSSSDFCAPVSWEPSGV